MFHGETETMGWKGGCEKLVGLGSESRNLSGVSTSELLKLEMELGETLGRGEEVWSESEKREDWRWSLDG